MKALASGFICTALIVGGGAVVGCDRTVEEKKTTETNRDGSTETHTEKKTVDNDGTVKTEKQTKETPPTNP
jgi:hypothetical protein